MKLVVLGANGRTGGFVLGTALARGMTVTGVVRAASKRPALRHPNLKIVVGDPCDPRVLKTVFRGHDAVVSALGARRPSATATSLYAQSAEAIVEAAWDTGLQRVLVTSTALLFDVQTPFGKLLRAAVPHVVRNAARMEDILAASPLQWTSARPGFLKNSTDTAYRAAREALPRDGTAVSRRAFAQFLIDAIRDPSTQGSAYGVSKPLHARPAYRNSAATGAG